ncbi:hypothetical protein HBI40_097740 [Parastagonospora nodorum]|nr:hypothetical protein HBH51_220750 [Parastagonospora nodorum]KAH4030131.1 hypothetical protein HBI13_037250 [Parastagonospora nodorum]KAH4169427.1 hypothetical protein HBH43_117300 [Parastagonospora nodorum]KAH4941916.1 hypothetical protein HBH74_064720 [Parastagonospora nodorum]KAH4994118.1 hypothetical protein HBI76_027670 [Parastagonospora nodorum]
MDRYSLPTLGKWTTVREAAGAHVGKDSGVAIATLIDTAYAHAAQLIERPAVLFLYTYFNRTHAPRTAARVHHNAKIASRRVVPDGLTGILPPVKLHTQEPFTETSST